MLSWVFDGEHHTANLTRHEVTTQLCDTVPQATGVLIIAFHDAFFLFGFYQS
jgi:hypothetical protein